MRDNTEFDIREGYENEFGTISHVVSYGDRCVDCNKNVYAKGMKKANDLSTPEYCNNSYCEQTTTICIKCSDKRYLM